ncbi:MAG: hypothetical protein QOK62_00085, partial [Nitrososphaeraceae archaeon]|nr:hypothetical protein [Nitrososphaeraceae archaeon]
METCIRKTGIGNLSHRNNYLQDLGGTRQPIMEPSPDALNSLSPEWEQENTSGIPFTDYSERVCVCVMDIIGSTGIVSTIGRSKDIRAFYRIFLNKISN